MMSIWAKVPVGKINISDPFMSKHKINNEDSNDSNCYASIEKEIQLTGKGDPLGAGEEGI